MSDGLIKSPRPPAAANTRSICVIAGKRYIVIFDWGASSSTIPENIVIDSLNKDGGKAIVDLKRYQDSIRMTAAFDGPAVEVRYGAVVHLSLADMESGGLHQLAVDFKITPQGVCRNINLMILENWGLNRKSMIH